MTWKDRVVERKNEAVYDTGVLTTEASGGVPKTMTLLALEELKIPFPIEGWEPDHQLSA